MELAESDDIEAVPWPCRVGPKVPDINSLVKTNQGRDIDSSLASLRRELSALQVQDKVLYKQLLSLRSSIRDLKENLQEKQTWELEMQREDNAVKENLAFVTKVEVLDSLPRASPRPIRHVKQDSGILTDEDSNDEERDDIFPVVPPPSQSRRDPFTAVVSYKGDVVSRKIHRSENPSRTPERHFSAPQPETERIVVNEGRPRAHTFSETQLGRQFSSMPVINETSKHFDKPAFANGKTFAFYGYRRTNENNQFAAAEREQKLKRIHPAFRPLSRHQSMPVNMDQIGNKPRSRSQTEPSPKYLGGGFKATVYFQKPLRRAASQLELSHRRSEGKAKQMEPYKIYRSVSQISLV